MRDYDIESDLKQEKFQSLKLVQGDRGNKIKINVYEDGQPVKLTGCSISAKYKRADGEVVDDGIIENINDNYFYAVMDSNITKVAGTLKMLFSIEKDDVKVSTFLLLADVRKGIGENTGSSGGSTGGGSGEVTIDLSNYYKKIETYSKNQIDARFKDIASMVNNTNIYNVKNFGAKGNANYFNNDDGYYYEDSNFNIKASDDTRIFQALIDKIGKKGGGTIKVPQGNYLISVQGNDPTTLSDSRLLACLYINYDNITIEGENNSNFIQVWKNGKKLNDNVGIFTSTNGKEYFYRGHCIMIGTPTSNYINNTSILNINFNGTCEPITLGKSQSWNNLSNNLISWDTTHKCIYYSNHGENSGVNGLNIINCIFSGYRGEVIYGGGNDSYNITIKNNVIKESVTGISCDGDMIIEGNIIMDISTNGIENNPTRPLIIKNNKLIHCFSGITIPYYQTGYTKHNVFILSNYLENCQKYGISIMGVSNVSVFNNTLIDCGVGTKEFDDTSITAFIGQCALHFREGYNDNISVNCNISNNEFIIHQKKLASQIQIMKNKASDNNLFITNKFTKNKFKRSQNAIENNLYFDRCIELTNQTSDYLPNIVDNDIPYGVCAYAYSEGNYTFRSYPFCKRKINTNNTNNDIYYTGEIMCDSNYVNNIDTSIGSYFSAPLEIDVYLKCNTATTLNITLSYLDYNKVEHNDKIIDNKSCLANEEINLKTYVNVLLRGRDTKSYTDGNLIIKVSTTDANVLEPTSFVDCKRINILTI